MKALINKISNKLIYFPTSSPRLNNCSWISFKNIKKYINNNGKTTIIFDNNKILNLEISYGIIDNQILRATRLEAIYEKRVKNIEKKVKN